MKDFLSQRKNALGEHLINVSGRIQDYPFVQAVHNGLAVVTPVVFLFAIASLLVYFPLEAYQQLIEPFFAPINTPLWRANIITSFRAILNVCFVVSIAFSYSEKFNRSGIVGIVKYRSLAATIVALVSYLLVVTPSDGLEVVRFAPIGEGVFLVLWVSFLAVRGFMMLSEIPYLLIRVKSDAVTPAHAKVVETLLPAAITISVFIVIRFYHNSGGYGIRDAMQGFLGFMFAYEPLITLFDVVRLVFKQSLVIFIGINGDLLIQHASNNHHLIIGNIELPLSFINHFVYMGGSGAALSLILAWWMKGDNVEHGYSIKLGTIPALFNINQVIFYCFPMIFNPIMLVPFILTPLVLLVISYVMFAWGVIPAPVHQVAQHVPIVVSGYYSTGSWLGSVLQFGLIIIGAGIYLPFLMLSHKLRIVHFNKGRKDLIKFSLERYIAEENYLVHRNDEVGMAARILSGDLRRALHRNELYLEYQPKVDYVDKKVVGVEALIRWRHAEFGVIPPPVIIALAEESDLVYQVSSWVIHDSIRRLALWRLEGFMELVVSINLSAIEFKHEGLARYIERVLRRYEVPANRIQIEIVESMELSLNSTLQSQLDYLVTLGVGLAIDDFGMGHSSAVYLKRFPIDTLKVDRVISVNAQKDAKISAILMGVFSMCSALHIEMVIEYIESEEQLSYLVDKGGRIFQGYIFSRPLSPDDLVAYIRECERSGQMFGL